MNKPKVKYCGVIKSACNKIVRFANLDLFVIIRKIIKMEVKDILVMHNV